MSKESNDRAIPLEQRSPEELADMITKLRKEAAGYRVERNTARDELEQLRAEASATPDDWHEQTAQRDATIKALLVEKAVTNSVKEHNLDAARLLDSASFLSQVSEIDETLPPEEYAEAVSGLVA